MPEDIIALIEKYPDFKPMYEQIYGICQNVEKAELSRQKEENERQKEEINQQKDALQNALKRIEE